jgi:hypothetical protein
MLAELTQFWGTTDCPKGHRELIKEPLSDLSSVG